MFRGFNHKKEFVGIDETDLKALGFLSIADLRAQAADFADLFVKTPGYIHNFKHVHWIDYIACGEDGIDAKAIIQAKEQKFTTNIAIKTIYLVDNPAQKAFIVELVNLRALSQKLETQIIPAAAQPAQQKDVPPTVTPLKKEPSYESLSPTIIKDPYEEESHEIPYEVPKQRDITLHIDDLLAEKPPLIKEEEPAVIAPSFITQEVIQEEEDPFANYVFDPHTASHDLGLPIDLVEEFVQDFIAQAKSFKEDLYNSLHSGNMDNLKIQSHKLKGVAANLRIEDALDALKIINTSHDEYEVKSNLDRFYAIIAKLAKEEPSAAIVQPTPPKEEEELILSFKEETPKISPTASEEPIKVEEPQETNEPQELPAARTMPPYDKKSVAHEIGLDLESFRELFEDYIAEAKEVVQTMQVAAQKGDLAVCKNASIKLKGMNENMRVHHFDTSLENILSATDAKQMEVAVAQIESDLALLAQEEDK